MLSQPKASRGFSLIELLIGLSLIATLVVMALPNFTSYLQNQRIRARAESITSALQNARQEALRTNTPVTFALVTTKPAVDADDLDVIPDATSGAIWVVAQVPGTAPVDVVRVLNQQSDEGGGANPPVVTALGQGSIVFDPLGNTNIAPALGGVIFTVEGAPGGPDCAVPGATPSAEQVRCLQVEVSVMGQIVMCDPAVLTVGDSRKCPSSM